MNRELLKICGIALFHFVAVDLIAPLVPQYAASLSLKPGMIGILISFYAFIPFLLALPGGALTDRFGTRRMLIVGVAIVIASSLLFAAANGIPLLFAAEVLAGLGHFIMMVSIQAHVSLLAVNSDQGFGYFTFAAALGTTVGPVIGGFVADQIGFETAFFTSAAAAMLAAVLILSLEEVRTEATGRQLSLADGGKQVMDFITNKGILMAMLGSIAMLFTMGLTRSFYPLYLEGRGFNAASIGLLIGIASAASTVVRLVLFKGIELWGRRSLFAAALFMGVIGMGFVPFAGSFTLLAVVAVIAGIGKGMSQPLSMILVANSTNENQRGLAMGFRLMGNRLGSFVSPLIFGGIVTFFSMELLFYVAAAVPLIAAFAVIMWIRSEPELGVAGAGRQQEQAAN